MTDPIEAFLQTLLETIVEKKGFNILVLDVKRVSSLTDYFVIAEGRTGRHTRAISEAVVERLKQEGEQPLHIEGATDGDWIVIDFGDVMAHLFRPGLREKYALEELWRKGKVRDHHVLNGKPPPAGA